MSDGDKEGSTLAAVVNPEFARQHFKGDALGKRFRTNITSTPQNPDQLERKTIDGIVRDVRYNVAEGRLEPAIYLPIEQALSLDFDILLRTTVEPASLSSAVSKVVTDMTPNSRSLVCKPWTNAFRS